MLKSLEWQSIPPIATLRNEMIIPGLFFLGIGFLCMSFSPTAKSPQVKIILRVLGGIMLAGSILYYVLA